jgi:signal transduction histidine kinase
VIDAQVRLRRLQDANRAIIGELDVSLVLQRIVEAARDLVKARYAALGVIGADGQLEQFIHIGMTDDEVATIGELPKGRGLLGALVEDPQPIRLADIRDDQRSSGFPVGHPPMSNFLGVPIRSRNAVYGNLYLTEREGGDFTAADEDLVMSLAATAGIAIENARLYADSRRRQEWLQASAEISASLLSGHNAPEQDPLQLIVETVRQLADADVVTLVLPSSDPGVLEVVMASGRGATELKGLRYDAANTLVALAMETGRGVRVGAADQQPDHPVHLSQIVEVGPVMAVPLSGYAGAQGGITVGRLKGRRSFASTDLEMAEAFASHAAVARELVEARADQQRLAVLEDRDRIARDLHDHVIQRLFADGLTLQSVAMMERDSHVAERITRVVDDIDDTIRQIRTSIFQLRSSGAAHASQGLRSAVLAIAAQVTPLLGFAPSVRFGGPIDTMVPAGVTSDVEAVVREGITNAAKHAEAGRVTVELALEGQVLTVEVTDDGVGFGQTGRLSGLANLRRRAEELGGAMAVSSPAHGGTQLTWTVPVNG